MLAIDDDATSGWHSFVHGETSLPQVLIIDMKETLDVTTITATGNYFNNVEFYIADDVSAGVNGYYEHNVNWDDPWYRAQDYLGWVDALKYNISDPAEWGVQKIGSTVSEDGASFSFSADYPSSGRYLIIRFLDSRTETYIAVFDLKVYDY